MDEDLPPEVESVLDKIDQQLSLVIKALMSMEERVTRSEDKISKLNMIVFKRLR